MSLRMNGGAALVLAASAAFLGVIPTAWADGAFVPSEAKLVDPGSVNRPFLQTGISLDFSDTGNWDPPQEFFHGQRADAGVLSDEGTWPDAHGSVSVIFGFMRASAECRAGPERRPPYGFANATVRASFGDIVTITTPDGALNGSRGQAWASIFIVGSGSAIEPTEWGGLPGGARADYSVGLRAGSQSFAWAGRWDSLDDGEARFNGDPFGEKIASFEFTFGEPFRLDMSVMVGGDAYRPGAAGSGAAAATLDAVQWMGLMDLRTEDGHFDSVFSAVSESGTDWSRPISIPEPAMPGVLVAAALLLRRIPGRN